MALRWFAWPVKREARATNHCLFQPSHSSPLTCPAKLPSQSQDSWRSHARWYNVASNGVAVKNEFPCASTPLLVLILNPFFLCSLPVAWRYKFLESFRFCLEYWYFLFLRHHSHISILNMAKHGEKRKGSDSLGSRTEYTGIWYKRLKITDNVF